MSIASFEDAGVLSIRKVKKQRAIKGVSRIASAHSKEEFWLFQGLTVDVDPGDALILVSRDFERAAGPLRVWNELLPLDHGTMTRPARSFLLTTPPQRWVRELSVEQTIRLLAGTYGLHDDEIEDILAPVAKMAQVEAIMHVPLEDAGRSLRHQIAFAVAANAPVPLIMFDHTAMVGSRAFKPLCLTHLQALREAGKALVVTTTRPQVALEVGTKAVIMRPKRCVPATVAEAAEFLIKDRRSGRKQARRRAMEDDDDPGLEF